MLPGDGLLLYIYFNCFLKKTSRFMKGGVSIGIVCWRVTKKVVGRTFLSIIQLVVVQGLSKRSASREDERKSPWIFTLEFLGSLLWQKLG